MRGSHECRSMKSWDSSKFEPLNFFLFRLEILITCQNSKMAQLFSSENPEMTQNLDNLCLEFHFSSNFRPSQGFDKWFIFRVEIKEKLNCSNFGPSGFHAHAFTCEHLIWALFWPSQGPSCLIFHLSHIAAIPSWNQIHGYSVAIVVFWQGWINGSNKTPIVKIPYFGLDHT